MRTWAFAAALASAGCGDSGGGGTAGDSPCSDEWCEGDPVGAWSIVADSACLARPVEAGSCEGLQCALRSASASGSLTLPQGGAGASVNLSAEGALDCAVPVACLAVRCVDLAGDCVEADGVCRCDVGFSTATAIDGVWRVDPTLGLIVEDAGTKSQWATGSYCVAGDSLELKMLALQTLPGLGLVEVHLRVRAGAG